MFASALSHRAPIFVRSNASRSGPHGRPFALSKHPNIVQVFDFGEVSGMYYLAMEYLDGRDLAAIQSALNRQGRPMPWHIAGIIVSSACEALSYAHTCAGDDGRPLNIVHRDISPSNLFVTYQGAVKVLDFGIAKAHVERTTGTGAPPSATRRRSAASGISGSDPRIALASSSQPARAPRARLSAEPGRLRAPCSRRCAKPAALRRPIAQSRNRPSAMSARRSASSFT
jgi:serine/threonine protein kinase